MQKGSLADYLEPSRPEPYNPTEPDSYDVMATEVEAASYESTAGQSGEQVAGRAWDPDASQAAWDAAAVGPGLEHYTASDAWNADGEWNPDAEASTWTSGAGLPMGVASVERGQEDAEIAADVSHS